ncbi:MAG TPA: NfeD family protein [Gaiellaceae bacterium]|nr:NfeD family protein [Gaiellaceae bacterium]
MLIFLAIALLLLLPSPWSVISFAVVLVLWVLELFGLNRTVRKRRHAVGAETLIGREAVVTTPCDPVGQVRLDGEFWEARCAAGAELGERVRVTGRERLTLVVEALAPAEAVPAAP